MDFPVDKVDPEDKARKADDKARKADIASKIDTDLSIVRAVASIGQAIKGFFGGGGGSSSSSSGSEPRS